MYCLIRGGVVIKRALKPLAVEEGGDVIRFLHRSRLGEPPPHDCPRCRGTGLKLGYVEVASSVEEAVGLMAETPAYAQHRDWLSAMSDVQRRLFLVYIAGLAEVSIPTITMELEQKCSCGEET